MGGLEALPRILAVAPATRIVVLSSHDAPEMNDRARQAGACAYFVKDRGLEHLVDYMEPLLAA
jgi:DNA-binding NarL/FixJ family response regulator